MARQHGSQIVGVFEDQTRADRAIADLRQAGFGDGQIGVIYRDTRGNLTTDAGTTDDTASDTGTAALTGMLTGAGLGALAGLGVLAGVIPVVGPAIAAGTLGVILSNAAAGAGLAGLTGALVGAGLSEGDASTYESDFEAGRVIVTVQADGRSDEALAILRRHGSVSADGAGGIEGEDMRQSGESMTGLGSGMAADPGRTSASGTRATAGTSHAGRLDTGVDLSSASTAGTGRAGMTGDARTTGEGTIELREERLNVNKQAVKAGEVEIRKEVVTEHKTIDVPIEREEVVIERHPASGRASSADIAAGGETIRIPIREEKVTVEKEAVVVEEVTVGKKTVRDTERVAGDVRKEELVVEEEGKVRVKDTPDSNPPRKR